MAASPAVRSENGDGPAVLIPLAGLQREKVVLLGQILHHVLPGGQAANARVMADKLRDFGWEYVVVDIQWYAHKAGSMRDRFQYIPFQGSRHT